MIGRPKRRACVLALAFGVACASEDPDVGASTTGGATTTGHAEGTATEADATGEPATGSEASSGSGSTGSGGASESDDGSGETGSSTGGEMGDGRPAGVFGGGPFYHQAAEVMPRLRSSGFNTAIIWTIHVSETGDFVLNDVPLFSNGEYIGDPAWPGLVASLEEPPTTVTRVEVGVGSYGVPDFEHIEALIAEQGTGPGSILRRNFEALASTLPNVDAINYDDESNYDVASTVELSLMLADLGFRITLTPYTAQQYWVDVYDTVDAAAPGTVDRVMLQVYAGGAGNDPGSWSALFDGVEVEAGLWSLHGPGCAAGDSPAAVTAKLQGWSADIRGGWMWLLDDLLACEEQAPLEDYASAIHAAFE